MTTLLRSGVERVLRVFYGARDAALHVRELSRRTGLTGRGIIRTLVLLEKEGYLRSGFEGNLHRFQLASTERVAGSLTLFDIERFGRLPKIRQQAIRTFLRSLPEQPIFAVLFGSTAKGTFTMGSDIDILLVMNRRTGTKHAEQETDALTAIRISPIQMTYAAFKTELKLKADPVVQSALLTGYPVINHLEYYGRVDDASARLPTNPL
jgi:predicted nucleotidyltransferase